MGEGGGVHTRPRLPLPARLRQSRQATGRLPLAGGFLFAIGLTVFQLVHFTIRERSIIAFPVQARCGYLLLLLMALPENLQPIYWIPVIGTWAQVLFGYCTMARTVSLLPWNRKQVFSLTLVKRTFLAVPVKGNILQTLPPVIPAHAPH